MRGKIASIMLLLVCGVASLDASAMRAEEVEYELYDSAGALKGSITYFCEGGKYQEGSLEVAAGDTWATGFKQSCSTGAYEICESPILAGDDFFDVMARCAWHAP